MVRLSERARKSAAAPSFPRARFATRDEGPLLGHPCIADPDGLERRAARESVWEVLTSAGSGAVDALRAELAKKKLVQLSREELTELLAEMLGHG